jgi:hypothetical protein
MTHPITVPLELVEEWGHDANLSGVPYNDEHWAYEQHIATRAAQWAANQELEACIEWVSIQLNCTSQEHLVPHLRAARRPKPPSLKKQALELARPTGTEGAHVTFGPEELELIRRALEQLDD